MKIKIFALLLALSVMICTGCSQSGSKSQNKSAMPQQGAARSQQAAAVVSDSVKQNATKTVTGTVQSIVGNEVVLFVTAETKGGDAAKTGGERTASDMMPGKGENATERPQRAEFASGEKMQRPQFAEGEMPQRSQFANGERPQRGEGMGSMKPTSEGKAAAGSDTAEKSDGSEKTVKAEEKTVTYLLPVGMKMGSKDFSSVTAGNTLKIYFGSHPDDGSEIITGVEVMGSRR